MLRIKLVKSLYGQLPRNRATLHALGLRRMHQVVEHDETPTILGMVHHVKHALVVETVAGTVTKKSAKAAKPKAKAEKKPAESVAHAPEATEAAPAPEAKAKKVAKSESEEKPKAKAPKAKKEKES